MNVTTTPPRDLEVWIDGDCAVCRRSQRWCAARDLGKSLVFRDLHGTAGVEPPADFEKLMREVHVRRTDGTIATGYDAWLLVLSRLPRWRRLAGLGAWPPIRRIGRIVYSFIARRRHRLARFIAPGSEGPPGVHGNGFAERPVAGDGCDQDVEVELDGSEPG
jgi:predicted DCC family thiol-disulfide oxidoreductase YuxK